MPKRVEAWATDDGTVFDNEQDARRHEARTRLATFWYQVSLPPDGSDGFADWAMQNSAGLIHALRPLDTQSTPTT